MSYSKFGISGRLVGGQENMRLQRGTCRWDIVGRSNMEVPRTGSVSDMSR